MPRETSFESIFQSTGQGWDVKTIKEFGKYTGQYGTRETRYYIKLALVTM
jgi:hypothetical protein